MSQSLTQLWTHIIFSTKERRPFLKNTIERKQVYDYLAGIAHRSQCEVGSIGGIEDHVHLLINVSKNIALPDFIRQMKASSSKWIKESLSSPQLVNFSWQIGYAAFSVSQSNVMKIKSYIENQEQHHKVDSFKAELEKFLIQHNVPFDQHYLWD